MNEINHPLKHQFLLLIENEVLLTWYKPKDLWSKFKDQSQTIKWQTYSLIRQLEHFGYVKRKYDVSGIIYYSETDKLTEFRVIHCKQKAIRILTEKLKLIELEKLEKNIEIQLTIELKKELPEISFCLKNYIRNNKNEIVNLESQKNMISNILNNIELCIY
ncbi:TPA: hypothetical protein ACGA3O_001392 [Acinetobacter baumannii]|uniref:hypothetical protein n=1 Tax=Acinetobacter calcoaceticus/baumannii complex TaxID=909768 RepID=UPI000BF5188D|nr:hypothetical protein [Acinetobacter baumannii]